MLNNWPYLTPCREQPELFDGRRGGEEFEDFVFRIDAARMKCDTQCKQTTECAAYATLAEVTGLCAGSLYEEGVKLERDRQPEALLLRLIKPKNNRKSMCCTECDTEYESNNKGNPLCRQCRRGKVAYFTGESAGEAGGSENPPSRVRRPASREAA